MSENFDFSMPFIKDHEGAWCNVQGDSGGESYIGASRNNFPKWRGWMIIDLEKGKMAPQPTYGTTAYNNWVRQLNKQLAANAPLQSAVVQFYQQNFWQAPWDQLDKRVAAKVMDISVNCGMSWGPKILQRACGVTDDGIVGPVTIQRSNVNAEIILNLMVVELDKHYEAIVAANPGDQKFLANWESRSSWLPPTA